MLESTYQLEKRDARKIQPTINAAYRVAENWHDKLLADNDCVYDVDGYDSYGYDIRNVDRAGIHENDYALDIELFYDIQQEWGFNGIRPVKD